MDVYVLVWSVFHYTLLSFLSIYLSKLKHNLKETPGSAAHSSPFVAWQIHGHADKIWDKRVEITRIINRKDNENSAKIRVKAYVV